jgi:hypothetical protein
MQDNTGMSRLLTPITGAVLLCGALAASAGPGGEPPVVVSFDGARAGKMPEGFRALSSAETEQGHWEVIRIDGVSALGQTEVGRSGYRLAVREGSQLADVRVGVRLRMGRGDRAAGVAWRIRDAGDYYAARLDLKDDAFAVYKFVRGNRVSLARLGNLRLDPSAWHEILAEQAADRIRVWLNGIPVASERDDALGAAGMVGLWTVGDSTAHFSRLWYEPIGRRD